MVSVLGLLIPDSVVFFVAGVVFRAPIVAAIAAFKADVQNVVSAVKGVFVKTPPTA